MDEQHPKFRAFILGKKCSLYADIYSFFVWRCHVTSLAKLQNYEDA